MQFCNSLLHTVNTTCNICPKVIHNLSKFTSETVRKTMLAILSEKGDDQPLFWHLQDWHQDKWRHLDCTALVLFLLGLQQSPWSNRRTNTLLQNRNLGHFSYILFLSSTQNKQSHTDSLFLLKAKIGNTVMEWQRWWEKVIFISVISI